MFWRVAELPKPLDHGSSLSANQTERMRELLAINTIQGSPHER